MKRLHLLCCEHKQTKNHFHWKKLFLVTIKLLACLWFFSDHSQTRIFFYCFFVRSSFGLFHSFFYSHVFLQFNFDFTIERIRTLGLRWTKRSIRFILFIQGWERSTSLTTSHTNKEKHFFSVHFVHLFSQSFAFVHLYTWVIEMTLNSHHCSVELSFATYFSRSHKQLTYHSHTTMKFFFADNKKVWCN